MIDSKLVLSFLYEKDCNAIIGGPDITFEYFDVIKLIEKAYMAGFNESSHEFNTDSVYRWDFQKNELKEKCSEYIVEEMAKINPHS